MRVIIVQYAGDYREAVYRFAAGGGETYHAQRYTVDAVAEIGQSIEEIAVLCCLTDAPYDERLPNGVRAIGAGCTNTVDIRKIIQLVAAYQPTHLILNFPAREILKWAIKQKIAILMLLADSFTSDNLRKRLRHYLFSRLLNQAQIQWIGNHGLAAAESLQAIGVNPNKIIPWDVVHTDKPHMFSIKTLSERPGSLLYVGSLVEAKGVGDALAAVAHLRSKHVPVTLKLAGKGSAEKFQQQAKALNIDDAVEFLGLVDNATIIPLMRAADIVLVPSRSEYPEGFPLTIYEALCSRTPIVASNHPMFVRQLQHGTDAMLFSAGDAVALANQIETLLSDPDLYYRISAATDATWQRLQLPVKWGELLRCWLSGAEPDRQWLFQHRLASGRYRQFNLQPSLVGR
jgi:glycosyltransferase involved in cell wall biosynthesis